MQWISAREEQIWNSQALEQRVDRACARVWRYRTPAVVLGCSQRTDPAMLRRACACGVDLVERRSGGGAVLVGPWMVGVSVALPLDHPLCNASPVGSYRWLGLAHTRALQNLGVEAHITPPHEIQPQRRDEMLAWACFGSFSPWEVAGRDGRKLVGLAQMRRRNGILLVAGTLADQPPWSLLTDVLSRPLAEAEALRAYTAACAEDTRMTAGARMIAAAIEEEVLDTLGAARAAAAEEPIHEGARRGTKAE